jgi:DNA-binding FadR family transcriptional regulator
MRNRAGLETGGPAGKIGQAKGIVFKPETAARTFSRRSLHGQVAHEIGGRIIRGELAPGDTLPNEAELSAEMNVSRTALRKAIKLLAAKGLVESRPKTGTRIRERSAWNMLDPDVPSWLVSDGAFENYADDLFEMRRIIEPAAAAIAAQRAKADAVAGIEEAYNDMVEAGEDVEAGIEPDLPWKSCYPRPYRISIAWWTKRTKPTAD